LTKTNNGACWSAHHDLSATSRVSAVVYAGFQQERQWVRHWTRQHSVVLPSWIYGRQESVLLARRVSRWIYNSVSVAESDRHPDRDSRYMLSDVFHLSADARVCFGDHNGLQVPGHLSRLYRSPARCQ